MGRRVVVRRHHAQRTVTHVVQLVVIGHVTRSDELDACFVQAALEKLLHDSRTRAGGHKHKQGIRLAVAHFLQERGKVRVAHGHAQGLCHLAAIEDQAIFEKFLSVDARAVVRDQAHHFLDAVFGRPVSQCDGHLRQREAGADNVRRSLSDAGGGSSHHHERCFGLRGDRCGGQG